MQDLRANSGSLRSRSTDLHRTLPAMNELRPPLLDETWLKAGKLLQGRSSLHEVGMAIGRDPMAGAVFLLSS